MQILTRTDIRKQIIASVLDDYAMTEEEFFARRRNADLTAARREAALKLKAANFTVVQISRFLQVDHSSVHHYLEPKFSQRKRDRYLLVQALKIVSPEMKDVIAAIARAEGVSPVTLCAEWLTERATFEAAAKAREAA